MALPESNEDIRTQLAMLEALPAVPAMLRLLREQTGMRFVGIARVTPTRWVTCAVLDEGGFGLSPGDELDVNTTLCKAQIIQPVTIAFNDAHASAQYRDHPAPRLYGFRSHISAAILLADGSYFGSLCALDPDPKIIEQTRGISMMEGMAALVGKLLDEALAHQATRQALTQEQSIGSSREQFLAVVAHDLRNPLATMHTAAQILSRGKDALGVRLGGRLHKSTVRMTALVNDLVDFARGRSGLAMPVALTPDSRLSDALDEVVSEARDVHPARNIQTRIDFGGPVLVDASRMQQLLSNLIGNALDYGAADKPILVEAFVKDDNAHIMVTNWGATIAPERVQRMFDAYWRGDDVLNQQGMGLGLHISQLIAKAHHGTLTVTSTPADGTRLAVSWPSRPAPPEAG